jgi:hypothetical protein
MSSKRTWAVKDWPEEVYPNSESRARYLIKRYRRQLIVNGALIRVGKLLVISGSSYMKWLRSMGSVDDFKVPKKNNTNPEG